MSSFNGVDFASIMKINGITIESGGGITELTDWTTRFADGPFSEGDTAVWTATGAMYRFSAALRGGSGDWVRSEVYDSSFVAITHIEGDEADETELLSHGWDTVNENGGGSISYNQSGRLKFSLTGTGGTDNVNISRPTTLTGLDVDSTVWASGLYRMPTTPNVGTVFARLFGLFDGTRSTRYTYAYNIGHVAVTTSALNPLNIQFGADSDGQWATGTTEKHLAFHIGPYISSTQPGMVRVWIDHALEPYWVAERDQGTATAVKTVNVGVFEWSNGGSDSISIEVRDWACGGIL